MNLMYGGNDPTEEIDDGDSAAMISIWGELVILEPQTFL